MLLEALSSAILGLALAVGAYRRLSHRLPAPVLVLSTGVAGALFGAFVMNTALDAGGLLTVLLGAAIVSVASLSLLLRPAGRLRRSATA
ncbi:hypothetical protein ACIHBQ_13655 [Streptomyces sp. NPDC052492]|uniref:hypothetical protein n=1 Tax=unclassified Streptomyces TaxID=2593676 RepID=UPI0033BFABDF